MKQITIRQLSCFCGFGLMAFKFLSLPSIMYMFNDDGGLFTALTLLVMDIAMIVLAIFLKKKFPDFSLYELISFKLGKIVAKIFYCFLALIFFCQMSFLLNEASTYMHDVVNEETTNYYVILILLPIVSCIVKSGLKNFARTTELAFTFVIIGFVICMVLGEGSVYFGHLGPFFEGGAQRYFSSVFSLSFFFTDFLFVYMILDQVQTQKKDYKRIFVIIAIVSILLIALYVSYFKLYSITANFHKNAIADVTQYRRVIGNVGNLDIFVILYVFFSIFFQGSMIFYSLTDIYEKVLGYKNKTHSIIFLNLIIVLNEYLFITNLEKITHVVVNYMKYSSVILFGVLPIYLLSLLFFEKRRLKNANGEKSISQNNS